MAKIDRLIKFAYGNAYDFKNEMKKKYSAVKVYDANGDMSARWYVYFSFRNPKTGKLERQPSIDTAVNTYKTLRGRTTAIRRLQKAIEKALENGYNPYEEIEETTISLSAAFKTIDQYALKNFKESSYTEFKSRIGQFENWLKERNIENIAKVTKRNVNEYLNSVENRTSRRNRNNTRTALQLAFGFLEKDYIIERNFIDDIEVLKAPPKRHKTYTASQEAKIFERLDEMDPELSLFVKFVSINMLRPVEVCRLQVKSIDIIERKLYFSAKNKHFKTKIIPEILLKELPDLSKYNKECYLFTPDGIAQSDTTEINRRDYWSKRFKKVVKDHFNLGADYTMYSFRHTFITKLYKEFAKTMTPFESKSKLMLITGHSTMTALEKYLRDIDAVLPDDYSKYL